MRKALTVLSLLAGLAATGQAQDNAAKAAAIKNSVGANQARLRKYQWIQTTKMSVDGELKQTTVASCLYPAGAPKPACTEISSTPTEQPSGGPIRKKKMAEAIAGMRRSWTA